MRNATKSAAQNPKPQNPFNCTIWLFLLFWRHFQNLFDPFRVSLSVCCVCLSACVALRKLLSPSLRLFSFLVSLCQLRHCPTYRCLPSLHLTACLKKINISVGREAKASIWFVYLGGRWTPEHAAQWCVAPLFQPLLSLSLSFLFDFSLPKSCSREE